MRLLRQKFFDPVLQCFLCLYLAEKLLKRMIHIRNHLPAFPLTFVWNGSGEYKPYSHFYLKYG